MRKVLGTFLLLVTVVTGALASGLGAAQAQDGQGISIRDIDATNLDAVKVTFFYGGDRDDLRTLAVRDGDSVVESSSAAPIGEQQALGIVLVIDASRSMEEGALIERVREAAHEFVDTKEATDQIAIVAFNSKVTTVQEFTSDKADLDKAIDDITLENGTALYDGIIQAANLYQDSSLQPNLVVFSDGGDVGSKAPASRAQAAVQNVGGALFALGVENDGFGVLEDIASETGGTAATAADASGAAGLFDAVKSTLRKQYVTTFKSSVTTGTVPLGFTVGNQSAKAEYIAGSKQTGAADVRPIAIEKPSGPSFLRDKTGLLVGLGLAAFAAVVAVFSVGSSFFGGDTSLKQALRPYAEGYVAADGDADDDGKGQHLAQTPLLQRAVEATGQFAERQGFLTKVEALLGRADLPLRPPEALFFYAAGVAVIGLLLVVVSKSAFSALIGVALIAIIPPAILNFLAGRRRKAFNSLLPDTLQLLASTLRAGFSLMQGVEAVSEEVSEPIGRELRRVVTEARLGRPLEESLDGVAERMGSADFGWAVMAIRIQREVGGNLAELLVTVADTMTERERLRRDVNALTAEGKVSAIVLGILPVGLGLFIQGANPGYMEPLFEETVGKFLLGGALALMAFGFWWMWKIIQIDI